MRQRHKPAVISISRHVISSLGQGKANQGWPVATGGEPDSTHYGTNLSESGQIHFIPFDNVVGIGSDGRLAPAW